MNTIVYFVYGSKREYQLELTYSVASAMRFIDADRSAYRIVLVTDAAGKRQDLPIEHVIFTPDEFSSWTQCGTYPHEAKVHALRKVLESENDKVALIDTDTYFRIHPSHLFDRIEPGRSVMHAFEGPLGRFEEWQALLQTVRGTVNGYEVDQNAQMFNSGVVGLHCRDRGLLNDVLILLQRLHAIQPVFSIEQFSFGAVLGRHTTLSACPDVILHYWGPERRFMHAQIAEMFPRFEKTLFESLRRNFIVAGYPKKRPLDQLRARWKSWLRNQGGDYRFAYLAYLSALSSARSHPASANVWARIAVETLQRNSFPAMLVMHDFKLARGDRQPAWMNSDTAAEWRSFWKDAMFKTSDRQSD